MAKNLITRNGKAVHAQIGTEGVPVCNPNMRSKGYAPVAFMAVDADKAPVTCKNCCRKLGIEAAKALPVAKAAAPAPVVTDAVAAAEVDRADTIRWAEVEVQFEGGTVMDHLHALAVTLYSYTKQGKAEARRAAKRR